MNDSEPIAPLLYVASALSSLDDDERAQLDTWFETIERVAAAQGEPLRIHVPFRVSAPWGEDAQSPGDIYRRNSGLVWGAADGLIVFGLKGGSLGAGQELAWAQLRGLPLLVLANGGPPGTAPASAGEDRLSRQVEGAASEADLTVGWFTAVDDLSEIVDSWIRAKRGAFDARVRARREQREPAAAIQAELQRAAAALGPEAAATVEARAGITPGRLKRLLEDVDAVPMLSLDELLRLAPALDVELRDLF
jgi:hypothetical protein